MDWVVGPIIEIVKLFGGPFVRYLKYQIKYNDLLQEFEQSKQSLRSRKHEIESKRGAQLESAPYHVATAGVEDWLKEVEEFIGRQDVVDEVNSWGYLSCCCRAVILEERTQELKEIYDRGDNYTRDCLVIEDHSRKLNCYVQKFNALKEKLQCKQGDIGSKLDLQLDHGKTEMNQVKLWRGKVEEMLKGVKDIEDKIGGRLSHSSDSLVMLLGEKIREMETMWEEGSQLPECLVIDDPSASAELPVSKLQGHEAVKAKILADLKGEEVAKLGVWGMGGIGKTTILKHVHNELLKEDKFKKIIWVTVSENFDTSKLQEQIAYSLKKELEEHQNETNRAALLSEMLEKQKPYLLILDDVWSEFKLEDVGIPERHVVDGCKLVLTTRSQEVARSMDCRRIQVKTLSKEEALKLFLNKVGDIVLSCPGGGIKRDLESTLKDIVDECAGLPLALSTVAGSLKGISDSRLWSVALNQLRDCKRNVAGTNASNADAFQILKFSYNHLESQQIKNCFLYCALYPEDHKIPMEKIIENWIDEGFIDEMESRQSMKDEGYGILKKFEDNSLLELIEDEVRGDCVRMHDLIRDMALDITRMSPQFLVEAGKALKELPEKVECAEGVEKLSLMHNYIEEIPSSLAFSTCKRLTTLLLAHNRLSTIPESVFEHIPMLKILDLSFNQQLSSLPNSVSKLVKLTTLLLQSTSLKKVPSLSVLGSLKKLNLRGTKIKEVPEGLRMLKNLKCLLLCGTEIDEIAYGVLSNLSKLQELIVNRSRIKLKGDVVGRLKKLEVLHGWFPTANEMRIFRKCQPNRLSDYFINIGRREYSLVTKHFEEMRQPRYKKVLVFTKTSIVGENMLFPSIQVLGVEDCHDIRSLNDFSTINDATDLRECWIHGCDGMECIFPSWINNPVVQTVEYLNLQNLHKLDGLFEANIIAKSSPPVGTFSSLKLVWLFRCKKLKKLFPSWKLVEYLQSLEKICVGGCEEMEEVITSDPEGGEEGGDIIKELILPKLKQLSLSDLPALKSICSGRAVMVSDSLEYIRISDCKGLRRVPFRLPPRLYLDGLDNLDWMFEVELIAMSPPQPCTFLSLKKIKIQNCRRVKKLFPSWKLVEYLQNLEEIEVYDCEEMEEIIGLDPEGEGEDGGDIIKELILPKLKWLELHYLRALKSICSRRAVMVCDSLESITISDCKGIRRIPFHLPPRLSLKKLDNLNWLFEVELIAMSPPQPRTFSFLKEVMIQECKRIKKLFPSWKLVEYLQSLEEIRVSDCEEMEEIIASDPEEGGEGGGNIIIKKLILPKFKSLYLYKLPALKSICSRRAIMVSDSLEDINITNCKALRRIPFRLPPRLSLAELDYLDWVFEVELIAMSPPQPCTFPSLKELKISKCERANKLFPSWKFVEYLQSLERIEVYGCEEMEEIIGSDPEEEGGDIIKKLILPKLKTLQLQGLPKLKSICSSRAVMVCDSFEIIIRDCKGLRRISFHPLPRLTLDNLDNLDWLFEVELIGMSPPQPRTFSSLKKLTIWNCKGANKLFPSWKLVEYVQSLEKIEVGCCQEMEELLGSDPEEEGEEGGDIIKKLILPKLKQLQLWTLPALKSICSRRAVMVCDSLESIIIEDCKGLRRIPLSLPLVDNAQPSPPLPLKKIYMYQREEEWWESLEWDHPNAKDVLRPMVRFYPDGLLLPWLQ